MNKEVKINNFVDNILTDKEIDKLVDEIMNIPIESNNDCLSTYGSVNVDELINIAKEMRKIPTFDNLLKENQKLKEQQKEFIKWLEEESKEVIRDAGYHQRICEDILEKYKEIVRSDK